MQQRHPSGSITQFGRLCLFTGTILAAVSGQSFADEHQFYHLESAVMLPSEEPDWDYVTFEPQHSLLYIGRRDEGLAIYDVKTKKVIKTIDKSEHAGAVTLVPEFDRAYTANEDGSTTVFQISTLKTLDRIKFGEDSDSAFYEPVTKQIVFTQGDSKQYTFMDARTGKVLGNLQTESVKLDGTVADGQGNLFTAERDRNGVLRVDAKERKITAEWKTEGCVQPTGLAIDRVNKRLFVGCRSKAPVLLVMDSETGKVVTSQEIGRGNDGVVYDGEAHKVYTSNGVDANLVIFDQIDANTYKLSEATTTRPYARTMALDPKTKKIYMVTAEGTADPSEKINTAVTTFYPNKYFKDTFSILTYTPK